MLVNEKMHIGFRIQRHSSRESGARTENPVEFGEGLQNFLVVCILHSKPALDSGVLFVLSQAKFVCSEEHTKRAESSGKL